MDAYLSDPIEQPDGDDGSGLIPAPRRGRQRTVLLLASGLLALTASTSVVGWVGNRTKVDDLTEEVERTSSELATFERASIDAERARDEALADLVVARATQVALEARLAKATAGRSALEQDLQQLEQDFGATAVCATTVRRAEVALQAWQEFFDEVAEPVDPSSPEDASDAERRAFEAYERVGESVVAYSASSGECRASLPDGAEDCAGEALARGATPWRRAQVSCG